MSIEIVEGSRNHQVQPAQSSTSKKTHPNFCFRKRNPRIMDHCAGLYLFCTEPSVFHGSANTLFYIRSQFIQRPLCWVILVLYGDLCVPWFCQHSLLHPVSVHTETIVLGYTRSVRRPLCSMALPTLSSTSGLSSYRDHCMCSVKCSRSVS
ncbi:hypothetical protein J6590_037492 [Homalodisca vitripennis]|nr:hypothetical protein J6590_037492 [Homalodisca vitripennis]